MRRTPNRREFLGAVAGGVAGLSWSSPASPAAAGAMAPQAPRPPDRFGPPITLSATRLGERLELVTGAGGNVVVAHGSDGALMVNGGSAERSAELLALVAGRAAGRDVRTLFNTDWHPHHTGSNETLGRAGATIIAHEHTKQYLGARIVVDWQGRTYPPLPKAALPTQTFYESGTLDVSGEPIEYGHLGQAHTDGDICVFFPGSNVMVAGDALSVGKYPIADYTTGGWIGGLLVATNTLLERTDAGTRIVPGIGPVQTRAALEAQRDMLLTLRDRLGKMMRQGMSADDMLAAGATSEFDAAWGDPELFVRTAARGLWLHVRELGGVV
jgi:glyoxylase-like metal-dependent hydrolase (beta-lactamase superfamily II)